MPDRVVVDANVLLKLAFPEKLTPAAERIAGRYRLTAPDIIFAEIANGLWKGVTFAGFAEDAARLALADLQRMVDPADSWSLVTRALDLAVELSHPVYDCLYAALAERERLALVTADKKLIAKLRAGLPELTLLNLHDLPETLP